MSDQNPILFEKTPESILEFYNTPYKLNDVQIIEYQKNGFIKLPNVLEGEALNYSRKIITAAVNARTGHDKRTLNEKSQYEQSFKQCGYLCWDYPAVKDYVFGKRFAGIARDLMKVNGVRLWHDQALYKEPGGRLTDCHQDESYWPINSENTITMWMALVDVPEVKGCMRFIPNTHKIGVREYVDIFNNPHMPETMEYQIRTVVPLRAGDVTFHSGLTFHEANPNKTDEMREAMTVIYFEDGAVYSDEDARSKDHKSCWGLKPGDIIDTQYTPKLI
ncbi:MAG: phytanoyl-CoA dioxygenase family protein [Bacteroidetes bacterium]|nr:phytanoyl-CoA dioxygenase family protein [Bacteroidota bacterium]